MSNFLNEEIEQAVNWHLLMIDQEPSSQDLESFKKWKQKDPKNEQAYAHVCKVWDRFNISNPKHAKISLENVLNQSEHISQAKPLIEPEFLKPKSKRSNKIVPLVAILCGGIIYMQVTPIVLYTEEFKTAIGQQRTLSLPDNSQLTLNTNTHVKILYSNHQRLVKLENGEVLVKVAKDASRPFIVATAEASARALGTQYQVKYTPKNTQVAVVESTVEVCSEPPIFSFKLSQCVKLKEGQGTQLNLETAPQVKLVNIQDIIDWSSGLYVMDNTPLVSVLQTLQPYSAAYLSYNPNAIAHLHVSGTLPLTNISKSMQLLANKLPIHVQSSNETIAISILK